MINIHYEDQDGKKDLIQCALNDRKSVCKYLLESGFYLIGES